MKKTLLLTKYNLGDQIKMDRVYSTYRSGEVRTGFWWGNLREGDHLEYPGIDGRIILKINFEKLGRRTDWIDLA
jgi:hypothetical protein